MKKIIVQNPVVELDGDEMTRIIWDFIKNKLILPYLDLDIEYYDLGMRSRDTTYDQITINCANAIKKNAIKKLCDKLSMKKSQSGNGSSCFKLSSVGNPLYFNEPLKNFTMKKTPKDTKSGIAPKKIASFQ